MPSSGKLRAPDSQPPENGMATGTHSGRGPQERGVSGALSHRQRNESNATAPREQPSLQVGSSPCWLIRKLIIYYVISIANQVQVTGENESAAQQAERSGRGEIRRAALRSQALSDTAGQAGAGGPAYRARWPALPGVSGPPAPYGSCQGQSPHAELGVGKAAQPHLTTLRPVSAPCLPKGGSPLSPIHPFFAAAMKRSWGFKRTRSPDVC